MRDESKYYPRQRRISTLGEQPRPLLPCVTEYSGMCKQDDGEVGALQQRYEDLEAFLQQLKAAESAGAKNEGRKALL